MKRISTNEFIVSCLEIYGNKKYDYSKVNYVNNKTKVEITCKIHNHIFYQIPNDHKNTEGCIKCASEKQSKLQLKDITHFIDELTKRYPNLNFNDFEYNGKDIKGIVVCNIHGSFKVSLNELLHIKKSKLGCPLCIKDNLRKNKTLKKEEFIKKAKNKHSDLYNYDNTIYINSRSKLNILCIKHNYTFSILANHHLQGYGCPICNHSKGELKIYNYLILNNIKFNPQQKFKDCKNIRSLRFDFYLPDYNCCIEFDGQQHFIPTSFTSNKLVKTMGENFKNIQIRDTIKNNFCLKNNINLLRINFKQLKEVDNILSDYFNSK